MKQLNEELATKMINRYFTDRSLQAFFDFTLESHRINHSNSKVTIETNFSESAIDFRYIKKVLKEMSVIYARLINQYKFEYQKVFSLRFDKQDEDNHLLDETELFINLNINHNLTETCIDNIDI